MQSLESRAEIHRSLEEVRSRLEQRQTALESETHQIKRDVQTLHSTVERHVKVLKENTTQLRAELSAEMSTQLRALESESMPKHFSLLRHDIQANVGAQLTEIRTALAHQQRITSEAQSLQLSTQRQHRVRVDSDDSLRAELSAMADKLETKLNALEGEIAAVSRKQSLHDVEYNENTQHVQKQAQQQEAALVAQRAELEEQISKLLHAVTLAQQTAVGSVDEAFVSDIGEVRIVDAAQAGAQHKQLVKAAALSAAAVPLDDEPLSEATASARAVPDVAGVSKKAFDSVKRELGLLRAGLSEVQSRVEATDSKVAEAVRKARRTEQESGRRPTTISSKSDPPVEPQSDDVGALAREVAELAERITQTDRRVAGKDLELAKKVTKTYADLHTLVQKFEELQALDHGAHIAKLSKSVATLQDVAGTNGRTEGQLAKLSDKLNKLSVKHKGLDTLSERVAELERKVIAPTDVHAAASATELAALSRANDAMSKQVLLAQEQLDSFSARVTASDLRSESVSQQLELLRSQISLLESNGLAGTGPDTVSDDGFAQTVRLTSAISGLQGQHMEVQAMVTKLEVMIDQAAKEQSARVSVLEEKLNAGARQDEIDMVEMQAQMDDLRASIPPSNQTEPLKAMLEDVKLSLADHETRLVETDAAVKQQRSTVAELSSDLQDLNKQTVKIASAHKTMATVEQAQQLHHEQLLQVQAELADVRQSQLSQIAVLEAKLLEVQRGSYASKIEQLSARIDSLINDQRLQHDALQQHGSEIAAAHSAISSQAASTAALASSLNSVTAMRKRSIPSTPELGEPPHSLAMTVGRSGTSESSTPVARRLGGLSKFEYQRALDIERQMYVEHPARRSVDDTVISDIGHDLDDENDDDTNSVPRTQAAGSEPSASLNQAPPAAEPPIFPDDVSDSTSETNSDGPELLPSQQGVDNVDEVSQQPVTPPQQRVMTAAEIIAAHSRRQTATPATGSSATLATLSITTAPATTMIIDVSTESSVPPVQRRTLASFDAEQHVHRSPKFDSWAEQVHRSSITSDDAGHVPFGLPPAAEPISATDSDAGSTHSSNSDPDVSDLSLHDHHQPLASSQLEPCDNVSVQIGFERRTPSPVSDTTDSADLSPEHDDTESLALSGARSGSAPTIIDTTTSARVRPKLIRKPSNMPDMMRVNDHGGSVTAGTTSADVSSMIAEDAEVDADGLEAVLQSGAEAATENQLLAATPLQSGAESVSPGLQLHGVAGSARPAFEANVQHEDRTGSASLSERQPSGSEHADGILSPFSPEDLAPVMSVPGTLQDSEGEHVVQQRLAEVLSAAAAPHEANPVTADVSIADRVPLQDIVDTDSDVELEIFDGDSPLQQPASPLAHAASLELSAVTPATPASNTFALSPNEDPVYSQSSFELDESDLPDSCTAAAAAHAVVAAGDVASFEVNESDLLGTTNVADRTMQLSANSFNSSVSSPRSDCSLQISGSVPPTPSVMLTEVADVTLNTSTTPVQSAIASEERPSAVKPAHDSIDDEFDGAQARSPIAIMTAKYTLPSYGVGGGRGRGRGSLIISRGSAPTIQESALASARETSDSDDSDEFDLSVSQSPALKASEKAAVAVCVILQTSDSDESPRPTQTSVAVVNQALSARRIVVSDSSGDSESDEDNVRAPRFGAEAKTGARATSPASAEKKRSQGHKSRSSSEIEEDIHESDSDRSISFGNDDELLEGMGLGGEPET
eukprot:TRINITY_DN2165_c0_g1_i1.p1 TRINITY_DN2165_c0_g1~~TRINITY_DN2165_c0_g1_i1.p1  ORF type:complete len:1720 (-),score=389.94 TRINITY_DN2165_c0_g1_i1:28-5187(-)